MHVLTLATLESLPRARVLARSLVRHQPSWTHEVVLVAGEDVVAAVAPEESLRLCSAVRELDLDIEALLALHDEQDLCTLLLPGLLRRHAERSSGPVLHLPSTVWVLADLQPIASALSAHSVLLVPRMRADVPDDGLEPSRSQMDRAGRIEQTIIGIDGSAGAEPFLQWWGAHVERALGSLDGSRSGERPEDRPWLARYLELAPARFSTAVLDDPGCNLNLWNLHCRTLRGGADGVLVNGRRPLRFLNLPGFEPDRPYRLAANASRARVSRSPALHELSERYAAELLRAGWRDLDRRGEVGRRLQEDLVYDESLRAAYASALALGRPVEDLFEEAGTRAFLDWLHGPAPRGAAHGINRYVFHRVARERPDVVRAYPDLDGPDGADYVAWCWAFGREEVSIPDRFMPPQPGSATAPRLTAASGRLAQNASQPMEDVKTENAEPAATLAASAPAPRAQAALSNGAQPAVRVTGYLSHTLGLGAAGRGYARALEAAGVAVSTASVPLHHLELPVELKDGYGRHSFEDVVHDGVHHGFEIVAVNAEELPSFVQRLGEDYFQGPRIGIWGWEIDTIPARWRRAFALVQEIWVYSRFMAENIGAVAPVPTIVLPPPVQAPAEPVAPLRLDVPEDAGFLFLFVFDYLSTIQRKNPVGLIEAFKRAFAPGEGPRLLIKTINGPLRPLAEEEVLWAAHGRPDIHVIDRSLSGAQFDGLMAACDCYVSLHRSEGFGLTMAEAMAIGKPVIGTDYSGNVDFMNSQNSYLVDYTIGRVGPDCEIYPPEGEWAQPSVEHAAELMRRVIERPEEAAAIGARARADIARQLSPKATGTAMRRRLEKLDSCCRSA
ncbi:MAG TPA: glycosyltransferase [Solirubrobacteraceae bacterium]|jgi:glycosyltransferase involved in cell wall biosynthesis|nr:glycosyltransferase [Solirubrobacteraceae bacterium]